MNKNISRVRNFSIKEKLSQISASKRYKKTTSAIQKRPFTSFFITLGLFLLILILGSVINGLSQKDIKAPTIVKSVATYGIGKTPTVTLSAQVESKGVIKIVAQSGGIVQAVNVVDGQNVRQGQTLVSLSSNYQGGSAPALQAQLAGAQLRNIKETYDTQKDLINKQRSIATASAENTNQLRDISSKSIGETKDLLSLNESLLSSLNDQITQLEQSDPTNTNLPTLRSQKAQLQSGVNQLRSGVRNLEYSTNTDNPPTTLSNLSKDITLKQLDLQEKALNLNKEVSKIQYNLALIQEGNMRPAAPFAGVVERVYVQVGQDVSAGDVIATLSNTTVNATAVLRAPREIAQSISRIEASIFQINGKKIAVTPSYVSSVATDGQLYSIIYSLPEEIAKTITDQQYLQVEVPVGYASTNSVVPFVPIDTVYESQNEATVYVVEKGKAVARKVTVGQLYGQYVEVTAGLKNGDQVIVDRNVVAGDRVEVKN